MKTVRDRLVARAVPAPGQTLHAFVLRLAEANAHPGSAWIRRIAGLPPTFASRPCDLTGLEAALGGAVPAAELAALASWPGLDGRIGVEGARVSPSLVDLARARICPTCLAEGHRPRPAWDCRLLVACTRHGLRLVDRCPDCARSLSWDRPSAGRCRCRADLATAPVVPAAAGALPLLVALEGLLGGDGLSEGPQGLPPVPTFDAAARLAWFAGTASDAGGDWRSRFISRPDAAETEAVLERAAAALLEWPAGVAPWLDGIQARHGEEGLRRTMLRMRAALDDVVFRGFVDEVRRQLSKWPGRPAKGWAAVRGEELAPTWLDATATATRLGTTAAKVATMLEAGHLVGRSRRVGGRREFRICAGSVARTGDRLAVTLAPDAAAARLGISRHALEDLRRAGLLAIVRPPCGNGISCAYSPDEVDGLVARIEAVATPRCPSGVISLSRVNLSKHRKLSEIIRGILQGACPVYRLPGLDCRSSLACFGVALDTVWGTRFHEDGSRSLDVRRAAEALGVATRMVPVLVRAGCLLAACDESNGRLSRNGVDERSVQSFRRDYVMAGALARRHATNTRTVGRLLREAGIAPVVRSNVTLGISAVWRTTDVAGFRIRDGSRRNTGAPASGERRKTDRGYPVSGPASWRVHCRRTG